MTLHESWRHLIENQTDETFEEFWKKYSGAEERIYSDLLADPNLELSGTISELAERFQTDAVVFMGFLDGIQDSLSSDFDPMGLTEASAIQIKADAPKLYFNMLAAGADYLYTLPQWDQVLTEGTRADIARQYKKSKTVVKGGKTGRNDPCPCGSGKKYKHCCGR